MERIVRALLSLIVIRLMTAPWVYHRILGQLTRRVPPESVMFNAAANGHRSEIDETVAEGVSVDAHDSQGWTPLMYAALAGHTEVVRQLLNEGAAVDATDVKGRTALMYAAEYGRVKIIRLLLARGASRSQRDGAGRTAREVAIENEQSDAASLLDWPGSKNESVPCQQERSVP